MFCVVCTPACARALQLRGWARVPVCALLCACVDRALRKTEADATGNSKVTDSASVRTVLAVRNVVFSANGEDELAQNFRNDLRVVRRTNASELSGLKDG